MKNKQTNTVVACCTCMQKLKDLKKKVRHSQIRQQYSELIGPTRVNKAFEKYLYWGNCRSRTKSNHFLRPCCNVQSVCKPTETEKNLEMASHSPHLEKAKTPG